MSKREEEKSPAISADALSAFAHYTPGGVAADFTGLMKGDGLTAKSVYPVNEPLPAVAETAPVAGEDWFELAGLTLVADGRISETRFRRAMDAVRLGVARE